MGSRGLKVVTFRMLAGIRNHNPPRLKTDDFLAVTIHFCFQPKLAARAVGCPTPRVSKGRPAQAGREQYGRLHSGGPSCEAMESREPTIWLAW